MKKPILCVDFDGVLHSYASGWQGPEVVGDPPVPGALQFLREATEHFLVAIYSSRTRYPGGIEAMSRWLIVRDRIEPDPEGSPDMEALIKDELITFPRDKPAAFLTIDDRAFLFEGTFPDPASLLSFKPWNKR